MSGDAVKVEPSVDTEGNSVDDEFCVDDYGDDAQHFSQEVEKLNQEPNVSPDIVSACVRLYETRSKRPTELELALTCLLLSECGTKRPVVIQAVCIAAIKWNRQELWEKAIRFCCDKNCVSIVRARWVDLAIRRFNFLSIKSTLEDIYRQETLIRPLLGLTDELLAMNQHAIQNFTNDPLPSEAIDWFAAIRQKLCETIGLSAKDSYDKLIHKCLTKGGISYMHEHVLPFCVDASTHEFLHELALRVHRDEALVESPTKRDVVKELLTAVLSKIEILPPTSRYYTYVPEKGPCRTFLASCLETNCTDAGLAAVDAVAAKIRSVNEINLESIDPLLSLTTQVADAAKKKSLPSLPLFLTQLQTIVCDLFLDTLIRLSPNHSRMSDLRSFCRSWGGFAAFLASISSRYAKLKPKYIVESINLIKEQFDNGDMDEPSLQQVRPVMERYVATYAFKQSPSASMEPLQHCFDFAMPDLAPALVQRMVAHFCPGEPCKRWEGAKPDALGQDSKSQLRELIAQLTAVAKERAAWATFGAPLGALIAKWAQIDAEDPAAAPSAACEAALARLKTEWAPQCACTLCTSVLEFLTDDEVHAVYRLWRVPAKGERSSRHLNAYLKLFVTADIAKWTVTQTPDSIEDLKDICIRKSHSLFRPSQWPKYKETVQKMLDAVSADEAERGEILGPEHEKLRLWMRGLYRRDAQNAGAPHAKRTEDTLETEEEEEKPLKKRRVTRNT